MWPFQSSLYFEKLFFDDVGVIFCSCPSRIDVGVDYIEEHLHQFGNELRVLECFHIVGKHSVGCLHHVWYTVHVEDF